MTHTTAIGITGARSLSAQQLATVQDIARQAAQTGIVYTGCAVGADAAAIAGASAGNLAHVWAVGNAGGQGFPRPGIPEHLGLTAWGNITWMAGGPLSLPLRARLARRSLAMVRAVAAAGGSLVTFPASPRPPRAFGPGPFPSCGSGTWATAGAAALLGVPVFVVWPSYPTAVLPVAGYWEPSPLCGHAAWLFVPTTAKMF
jgi:hypothetical protein